MADKLGKSECPKNHSKNDFRCFGPVATKDTMFAGTKMADMGCFSQEEVDSNKYYFCCICQSKKDNRWYVYVEYGREGASNPQYQFTECANEADAQSVYEKQCAEKNTKRGQWDVIGGISMYVPKPGKDLYRVRQLAKRTHGLPDAQTISSGVNEVVKTTKSKTFKCDQQTTKLMRDLIGGTISYARSNLVGGTIPVQSAIDEARQVLDASIKRISLIGNSITDQVNDKELKSLTYALYSKIPKIKPLRAKEEDWILSKDNIQFWNQDIDAFESALKAGSVEDTADDPMASMPLNMEWIDPRSDFGVWFTRWYLTATKGKHSGVNNLRVLNVWKVERDGDIDKLQKFAISAGKVNPKHKALFQPAKRHDLDSKFEKLYQDSHISLLIHGSASVNVPGILREGFRFPKELVGVKLTAQMFGQGTYFADDIGKSLGYTSYTGSLYARGRGAVGGRGAFMLICDVHLGNPHLAERDHGYTSAPSGCHCVFGKGGYSKGFHGPLQNNEWIIYDKRQFNIRYLVEFE